jgi:hypothetical protein
VLYVPSDTSTEIIASLIAIWPPSSKYVLGLQVYCHKLYPRWASRLYEQLVAWTEGLGLDEIRAEIHREVKGFQRRWGFETHGVIIKTSVENAKKVIQKQNRR